MMCMNQCDYPDDDGGPCRCVQDAMKVQASEEDKELLHSEYRVVRRSIDAGHGWSCADEYEVRNEVHIAAQVQSEISAIQLAASLNELRAMKLSQRLRIASQP